MPLQWNSRMHGRRYVCCNAAPHEAVVACTILIKGDCTHVLQLSSMLYYTFSRTPSSSSDSDSHHEVSIYL